jgi:heme exporter protein D
LLEWGLSIPPPFSKAPTDMNWSEFFHMGGYALYVWVSYGLMAVVLILNLVIVRRRKAEVNKTLRRLLKLGRASV